jgi:DNA-binding transcriptional ArsR family regulator
MNMSSYSCIPRKNEYQQVGSLSSLLNRVGEESRLKILCILKQGRHCVCEVEKHVGLSQSLTSHHLADLKAAGLITDKKKGLWVHYCLTDKGRKIVNLLFSLEGGKA